MKAASFFKITLIAVASIINFSCEKEVIRPSGSVSTLNRDISGFNAIDVSSDFDVYVTFAEGEETVRLEVDESLADRVIVEKSGTELVIKVENGISIRGDVVLEAYITVPYLNSIRGRGDAAIVLENELIHPDVSVRLSGDSKLTGAIQADLFDARLSGDSKFFLTAEMVAQQVALDMNSDSEIEGGFVANRFDADLSGDSKLSIISGQTDLAFIEVTGDSFVEGFALQVEKLEITLKSNSKAQLTVNETIDMVASGDSQLEYQGDAIIQSQSLSGDSRVIKVN